MAYQRGFKASATGLAAEVRTELGLRPLDRLDPRALAKLLAIPLIELSSLAADAPAVRHLLNVETEVFSAVTVFDGPRRAIVHNDCHAPTRQNSNVSHELSHGLLHHPPTPALDDRGCRIWDQGIEDEATWLAGCLLVTERSALMVARGYWTIPEAAERLGVSEAMIRFRLNATGATTRVRRAAQAANRVKSPGSRRI
jgi:Zn-dependent peptidase ImmA (M78 family)